MTTRTREKRRARRRLARWHDHPKRLSPHALRRRTNRILRHAYPARALRGLVVIDEHPVWDRFHAWLTDPANPVIIREARAEVHHSEATVQALLNASRGAP